METTEIVFSAIRSIGTAFPCTAPIVNMWNEHSSRAQAQNCQKMINSLVIELDRVEEKITHNESACAQVFALGMRKCLNDPEYSKATLYSMIIAQFCDGSADKETAINLIYEAETLLDYDLGILAKINGGRVDSTFNFDEETDRAVVSKCQTSIKKLEGKGLVFHSGENTVSFERVYNNGQVWPYTFYQEYYMRSNQGKALIAALERREAQEANGLDALTNTGDI